MGFLPLHPYFSHFKFGEQWRTENVPLKRKQWKQFPLKRNTITKETKKYIVYVLANCM